MKINPSSNINIASTLFKMLLNCFCRRLRKNPCRNLSKMSDKTVPGSSKVENERSQESSSDDDGGLDKLTNLLTETHLQKDAPKRIIEDLSLEGLTNHWKTKGFKNVITMVGAGISTSAGIPDFRSPGTGLYHNLQKYNLPHPTAIFEMSYFHQNPKPFFVLAKELYPGEFKPTPCHYFVRLLHEKGVLKRHYTQNIDTLERVAGVPGDKLVEAHGTFYTNHCLKRKCRKEYSMEWMKEKIFNDEIPECEKCNGLVKPDIVFFGENLPEKFHDLPDKDFRECDLLIIMGTSLEVQPFASLVDHAGEDCLRLLINRDKVGRRSSWFSFGGSNLRYDCPDNVRDSAFIGDCDDGIFKLVDLLGWGEELREMIKKEHADLDKKK